MSYTDPTPADTTFNAEYVELVTLGDDSVTDALLTLARDHRLAAQAWRSTGTDEARATAGRLDAAATTYEHAVSLLDLAWTQAMARVARQVTA